MLAQRGWREVHAIEKRPSADYYEPDRSFTYQVDGRGQKLTDLLGLTPRLAELSVPNTDFYFTLIRPDGTRQTSKLPIADPNRKTAYWLSRPAFVQLLYQEIRQNWPETIRVWFQTECVALERHDGQLQAIIQSPARHGERFTLTPTLLLGCDGLNSLVRQTLHQAAGDSRQFAMRSFPSASAGLKYKYKVLTLPPQFPLSEREGDRAQPTMAYGIRSAFRERKRAISLGLLPLKNPESPRPANIIAYPNHAVWQLETPEEVEGFLRQAFPQLPLDKMLSAEEVARFAASKGGRFPQPQYCPGLYQIWGEPQNERGTAVVLLGDAVHCFPPDIGQGVNAALEDAYILHEALAQTQDDLTQALPYYQRLRQDDVKALIRLAQISYPWQYNQAPLRKKLWSVNFFIRFLLSRFLPGWFAPHSFLLIQNHALTYSEILEASNRTTRRLGLLALALVLLAYQLAA